MSNNIFSYLKGLKLNNDREWYHAHKSEYKVAMDEFENIIKDLILEIGEVDDSILHNEPKDLTFKLVRDTRFSHDKSPYNPVFRCHISAAGKLPIPVGYYLYIAPYNNSFLGGGLFADVFKDATQRIREHIFHNSDEFLSIVDEPEFKKNFKVQGTMLKRVPGEYPKDCSVAEFLKYKSWYIEYPVSDANFEDISCFISFAAKKFLLMKPFNDFLNQALDGFVMPER